MRYGRLRGSRSSLRDWSSTGLSAVQILQKLPRVAQQFPNPPSLFTGFPCIEPVFECVLITFRCTRAGCATVHAAASLARNRWRPASKARPRLRTTTRARQHRAGVTDVLCHCALLPCARAAPRRAQHIPPAAWGPPVSGLAPAVKPANSATMPRARPASRRRRSPVRLR